MNEPSFDNIFALEDYFPNNERFLDLPETKNQYEAMQRVFEGRDLKSTLKKLFPEVIFQLIGPRKSDGNSFYTLQMVVVPFKMREQGLGSKFMNELVTLAKKENVDIFLTPDASYQEPVSKGGMTKGQLTQWYKTFGFKKKEKSDFRAQATYCYYSGITEMAISSGVNKPTNFSGATDWDFYQQNRKFISLVVDNLPKRRKVFKTKTAYFLTDKDEKYLGKIEVTRIDKEAYIASSHSTIKGLYATLFPIILKDFKRIVSDYSLSTQAIKSYTKLSKSKLLDINIETDKGIVPFSKKTLLDSPVNRVIVEGDLFLGKFYERYQVLVTTENELPSSHRKMLLEEDPELERFLYGNLLENL